ncbi:MAG: prepilin-type N-terminal cleavage/methylation domain-containing protein [Candidatus Omnitrophota bacterium]|nr:prepilin-type N-terminal cleavage/methylation domain-containing protein [Candidatus Omnitrophota bacterium]MDZ4243114.1 prepilin-type N-terminal cleavage/methylation domain-containing protein [Candidatus Omnitrophota bacterium]
MKIKGFTLLEIITVLVIVSGMAAFAIPNYMTTTERYRAEEGKQVLIALLAAQKRFNLDTGAYTGTLANLDVEIRPSAHFGAPAVTTSTANLANITRTGSYTLQINENGIISCSGGPANLCTKIGF